MVKKCFFTLFLMYLYVVPSVGAAEIPANPSNFTDKLKQLNSGDTLILEDGTYQGFTSTKDGTSTNPITIKSKNPLGATISGDPDTYLVNLNHKYWVLDGFKIHKTKYRKVSISQPGAVAIRGEGSTLKNSRVWRNDTPYNYCDGGVALGDAKRDNGIMVLGNNITIENNDVFGFMWSIRFNQTQGKNIKVVGNKLHGTGQSPIIVHGPLDGPSNSLIHNNYISYSAVEDGIQFDNFGGSPDIGKFVISNNVFEGNAENALDFKGGYDVLIENNVFMHTQGSNDGGYPGCTSWSDFGWGTISRGSQREARHIVIRNNVFYQNGGGIDMYDDFMTYNNVIIFNNYKPPSTPNNTEDWSRRPIHRGVESLNPVKIGVKNSIIGGQNHAQMSIIQGTSLKSDYNLYFPGETGRGLFILTSNKSGSYATIQEFGQKFNSDSNSKMLSEYSDNIFVNVPNKLVDKDYSKYNFFTSTNNINAYKKGGHLTTVSGVSGNTINVVDSDWFTDGWAVDTRGDTITIGNQTANIVKISGNSITLDKNITVNNGDKVYWGNTNTPNIGLLEGSTVGTFSGINPSPTIAATPQISPSVSPVFDPKFDLDENGVVNILDIIDLIRYLFQ